MEVVGRGGGGTAAVAILTLVTNYTTCTVVSPSLRRTFK